MESSKRKISSISTLIVLCVFVMILLPEPTSARPSTRLSRQRRLSDQRLAEIETLLALEKMKGRVVTIPIAFGVLDPNKIGRRRRSVTNDRFETLKRILQVVTRDPNAVAEENEKIISSPLLQKNEDDRRGDGVEYNLI